jgi:hypothetical protein
MGGNPKGSTSCAQLAEQYQTKPAGKLPQTWTFQ